MSKTCDEIAEVLAEIRDLLDQRDESYRQLLEAVKDATK